jgi:hypothetical protein
LLSGGWAVIVITRAARQVRQGWQDHVQSITYGYRLADGK